MAATNDRVPCVFINNSHVENLDPVDPINLQSNVNTQNDSKAHKNKEQKPKGQESHALVNQVDFYASFAILTGQALSAHEAPDSINLLDALTGNDRVGRENMVLEGMQYKKVFRDQRYVYIPPHDDDFICQYTGNEKGNTPEAQLFDLQDDVGQVRNLAEKMPEKVTEMATKLAQLIQQSHTR